MDLWQRRALNRALAINPETGRLLHRVYLVSTGRQQGKTLIVRGVIGWALTALSTPEWIRILGLAHDRQQARIPYESVREDLDPIKRRFPRAGLALTRYLGIRSDLYGRHREYHTSSRESRNAARGWANDLGVFDEIRTQVNYETWNALEPTTRARPEPLILGISSAGDDRSVLLRDWWERGRRIIDGVEPADGFGMTWYAAPNGADPEDPAAILAANPAVAEGRLAIGPVAASIRTLTPSGYLSETLNLWTEGVDEWLPSGAWQGAIGPMPARAQRIVLGVEAVPTWRRATVTVAIVTDAGVWIGVAGELDADRLAGPTVAPGVLARLVTRLAREWHASGVAYSAAAAAAPHVKAAAERARVEAIELGPRQIRAASALFRSELVGSRLMHPDDPLLAQQARVARPSAPIDAGEWYLSTRESGGEIDAIRAAAWAAWAAIAPEARPGKPAIH